MLNLFIINKNYMPRPAKRAVASIFKNICDFFHFSNIFCIILIKFCGKSRMSFVKFRKKLKYSFSIFFRFNAYLFARSPFFPYVYHLFFNFPLIFSIFLFFFPNFSPFLLFSPEFFHFVSEFYPISVRV